MNILPKAREQAKQQLEVAQRYKRLFESDDGEAVLHDLFRNFFMMRHTYNSKNRDEILVNEGSRSVVLYLLSKIKIDEKKLMEIISQANDR